MIPEISGQFEVMSGLDTTSQTPVVVVRIIEPDHPDGRYYTMPVEAASELGSKIQEAANTALAIHETLLALRMVLATTPGLSERQQAGILNGLEQRMELRGETPP